jgi:hypothetical protein
MGGGLMGRQYIYKYKCPYCRKPYAKQTSWIKHIRVCPENPRGERMNESERHQPHVNGEGTYDFKTCAICQALLKNARTWSAAEGPHPGTTADADVVDAYRFHAQKMSES